MLFRQKLEGPSYTVGREISRSVGDKMRNYTFTDRQRYTGARELRAMKRNVDLKV